MDWDTAIDRSRWFFAETLTPLAYTGSYAALSPEQRRRYNQLTGMLSNELILYLETGFLNEALGVVARRNDDQMTEAIRRFQDDEQRHADLWRRLNRLSAPEWYSASDRHLLKVPAVMESAARALARRAIVCPVVFWVQLAQEERSIEISRRCLQMPADQIEPRYAAVYGAHMRDEVRHVQLDAHLIERFHASQPMVTRRLTAIVFRWIVANLFLKPIRSSVRVIEALAIEYPELKPEVPTMVRQLRALAADESFQTMMYSRHATPITFDLFDRFPEFHSMRHVLRAYTPAAAGRPS